MKQINEIAINRLLVYKSDLKIYVFNEEHKYYELLKDRLFKLGFKINDFYYRTIAYAFNEIDEFLKNDDDLDNYEMEIESDVYTYDLLNWLSEDLDNIYYCDDVIKEYSPKDMINILQIAQYEAKREIYGMAINIAKEILENE